MFNFLKSNLISLFIFVFTISCNAQIDCKKLNNSFSSFEDAEYQIENARFLFVDIANTSKSSWIRGASFYSCDNNLGYFILKTDSKNYIYSNLPISVWYSFKNASSHGSFYSNNIRNKYQLFLSN